MKASNEVLTRLLYKLSSQWTWAPEYTAGKRAELQKFVREVGEQRAEQAVDAVVQNHKGDFCPPMGKIREYCPEGNATFVDPITEEERRDRAANPDNYFGWPDCVAIMHIIKERQINKQPRLSHQELIAVALEMRHSAEAARRDRP